MYPNSRGSGEGSASARSDRPFYPVLGQPQPHHSRPTPPPQPRQPPPPPPSPPDGASGSQNPLLRVQIAEPFRTMPPVLLRPGLDQVPRSQAAFDFDLERRVLSEDAGGADAPPPPPQPVDDPFQLVLERYMQMGYERDEVAMALAAHDGQGEQGQVIEFCRQYKQLKSMGFAPPLVAGALMRHRDDLAAATEACLAAQGT